MLEQFFYSLRGAGLTVGVSEWLTLQEALEKNLCQSSLNRFYYVARIILIKREIDYDKYDQVFDEYFKRGAGEEELRTALKKWLDKEEMSDLLQETEKEWLNQLEEIEVDTNEVTSKYKKRLKEQDSEHNGGNYWIGTMGKTSFGNTGGNVGGIRVGGKTGYQSAFQVIAERKYKDFRDDRTIDNRQFQMALRRLRQFAARMDLEESELDLQGTIQKTCNQGGYLHIQMQKPRKNSVKLLLLMDSGGTMIPYCDLLNELFQAVSKSNHFKDVSCYYFHNCVYSHVYDTPECENGAWITTESMFRKLDKDYKVIIVGDAAMAPEELYSTSGNYRGPNDGLSGLEWLEALKRNYKKIVWMNPKMARSPAPWREAETHLKEMFPMFRFTVDGLEQAMKYLINSSERKRTGS
ncbi:MAG: VWA containing CoxE family protein [Eubacteriales bacterium]